MRGKIYVLGRGKDFIDSFVGHVLFIRHTKTDMVFVVVGLSLEEALLILGLPSQEVVSIPGPGFASVEAMEDYLF